MTKMYSADAIKKDFDARRISKRVAKQRLIRSDAKLKAPEARHQLQKWDTARPAKVRNAGVQGVKTGAKGKAEQAKAAA